MKAKAIEMKARIKKGVKPYGGRLLDVESVGLRKNGRKYVVVHRPKGRHWFRDLMEYEEHEVELVQDDG